MRSLVSRFLGATDSRLAGLALLVGLPLLVTACSIAWGGWPKPATVGDMAVTELDTQHALHFTQSTGPYSRFGFCHPGPLLFYLLAPFYWIGDYSQAGLCLGAVLLNLAGAVAILVVVSRFTGGAGRLWCALLLTLYVGFLSPVVYFSAWGAFIVAVPCGLAAVLLAAVAAGRLAYLPAAVLVSSFAVQTHVGCGPAVGSLTVASLLLCFSRRLRAWLGISGRKSGKVRKSLWAVAAVLIVVWTPPAIEQAVATPGNLGKLCRFFAQNGSSRSWQRTFDLLVPSLTAFPLAPLGKMVNEGMGNEWYLREYLLLGTLVVQTTLFLLLCYVRARCRGHRVLGALCLLSIPVLLVLAVSPQCLAALVVRSPRAFEAIVVAEQFLLLLLSYFVARHLRHDFLTVLCLFSVVLWAAFAVSVQRIVGESAPYLLFWMAGFGLLSNGVIGGALLPRLLSLLQPADQQRLKRLAAATAVLLIGVCCARNTAEALQVAGDFRSAASEGDEHVEMLGAAARTALGSGGYHRCLIKIVNHDAWPVAAGIFAQLTKADCLAACDPQWTFMFGPQHAAGETIDGVFLVCQRDRHKPPRRRAGAELVAQTATILLYWRPTAGNIAWNEPPR